MGKRDECSESFFEDHVSVSAVLLSSWNQGEHCESLRPLIEKLLHKNCSCFICVGINAEALHDFIDDVIVDLSVSNDSFTSKNVITTWHDEDTSDEVSDFFLNFTDIKNGVFLVLFSSTEIGDQKIEKSLQNLIQSQ